MNCRDKLLSYFRQRNRGWVFTLFAAVCIVYLPFLGSPLVFDDLPFFAANTADSYTHLTFLMQLRWVPYASLGWTTALFSDVLTYPYRLSNLLLHAVDVILLFLLLRRLITAAIPEQENSPAYVWGPGLGALIFACHPVAVYAVGYVVERSILMATLFSLLMQWAYLRGLLTGRKRWFALAVSAYFLAVFSKEHSVMAPALLAAETFLLRTRITAGKSVLWATWIALLAISLKIILLAKGVSHGAYEPMAANSFAQHAIVENTSMLHVLSALTQAGLFFKYLLLWVLPNPAWMSVDMRVPFVTSWLEWQGWLGAIGFIAYGMLGGWLLLRPGWAGLLGLALLYPWLLFLVEFPVIRVQEPFVLYRSYLWMPGIMLFFPILLAKLPGRRMLFGLSFIALLLVPLAWNRLWVFADNYRLWNDAALLLHSEKETGADRIFYNRGQAELAARKWQEAAADFQRAIALSPQFGPIHSELGVAYLNLQRYQEALAQFDQAISLKPDDANFYYGKALALKRMHQDDLAIRQMEKSCALKNISACAIVQMNSGKK